MREFILLVFVILSFVAVIQESQNGVARINAAFEQERTLAAKINWANQYR